MSFSSYFTKQWESFTNYIVSDLVKKTINDSRIDEESVMKIYRNEILRWTVEGQYNYMWLNDVRKASPEIADEILCKLEGFAFRIPDEIDQKSGVPMAPILTVAGAAAGAGVASVLRLGIFPVLGLGLLCGIVGGVSGKTISQNQKGSKSNTLVEEYKKQLSALGSEITNKVSSIDGKEPSGLYQ